MRNISISPIIILVLISVFCIANGSSGSRILISPDGCSYETVHVNEQKNWYKLYKHNLYSKSKVLYNLKQNTGNCGIGVASLDTQGSKLALSGSCIINTVPKNSYRIYRLVIVDRKNNKEIAKFNNAHLFCFSPEGDGIVFNEDIFGERGTPPPPDFKEGIWIYYFKSGQKIELKGIPQYIIDVNWSDHDGNIYIAGYDKVVQYDVAKRASKIVPYKGIYFSKDGKYYANKTTENSLSGIYRTSDNAEMVQWEKMVEEAGNSRQLNLVFVSKELNAFIFYFGVTSGGINNVIRNVSSILGHSGFAISV